MLRPTELINLSIRLRRLGRRVFLDNCGVSGRVDVPSLFHGRDVLVALDLDQLAVAEDRDVGDDADPAVVDKELLVIE